MCFTASSYVCIPQTAIASESIVGKMVSPNELTFRLRGCSAGSKDVDIRNQLSQAFGDVAPNDIKVHSLAASSDELEEPRKKTATLTFSRLPSAVDIQKNNQWRINDN
ncbi:hypothetical protein CMQ_6896 [Grosmannia clavigera kw1407]|uniref:Uncharacterized protein n=1 Tax=Grosmannia clavigera (strain kw1407 / UAMH 11150) TaxID=655863 RepID=F0X751_GROCL|nr:uncharacterized protein CMQ_6896 [Grosmannia clavigera kw1407]EFX06575.1 hypothetical protein CMQ_6896 [Grosmannia clavigera kw1407]